MKGDFRERKSERQRVKEIRETDRQKDRERQKKIQRKIQERKKGGNRVVYNSLFSFQNKLENLYSQRELPVWRYYTLTSALEPRAIYNFQPTLYLIDHK